MAEALKEGTVFVDTETVSSKSLTRDGLWPYAQHAEITTAAIAVDGHEVRSLDEMQLMCCLREMAGRGVPWRLVAHNVAFDRAVIEWRARRLGVVDKHNGPLVPPDVWCCTQLMARSLNLPASLKDVCRFLWPDEEGKDMEGHALVADEEGPGLFDADIETVKAYCRKDVELMRRVYNCLLPHVSELDVELGGVDSSINLRGLPIDVELCKRRAAEIEKERIVLHDWAREHYPGTFISSAWSLGQVSKVDGLVERLRRQMKDKEADELQAKRDRYGSIVNAKGKWEAGAKAEDGRARCCFLSRSTQSGRFAGKSLQPQNLIRNTGDLKLDTRNAVGAPEGRKIITADYRQIELRLALWIAGLPEELRSIEEGSDFYSLCAEKAFGRSPTKDERQSFKSTILGLQYGLGKKAAIKRMLDDGSTAEQAEKVWGWLSRKIIPAYRKMWEKVEEAARARLGSSFASEGQPHSFALLPGWKRKVVWHGLDDGLSTYLENKKGSFVNRKWWPGAAASHLVSGLAADIMVAAMIRVERAFRESGLSAKLVGSVHDELISECGDDEVEAACDVLRKEMPAVFGQVRLDVSLGVGQSWAACK